MASELRNKGQLKPNALKNTVHHSLGSTKVVSWNMDKKLITDSRLSTMITSLKWPLKHRIVLSIEMFWQKLSLEWYSTGCRRPQNSLDAFLAPCYSRNSNYKLTKKIVEFLWLYLCYFSVFSLGFQKLGEQANVSSSFRQRLFVFLFLDKLVKGFLQSWKARAFSFSHNLSSSGNFFRYYPN